MEVMTMHTRSKSFRTAAILLSTAVLIFTTAACGNGTVVKPEKTSKPSPTPKTVSETFTDGAKQALLDAVKKSERLSSAQLNLLTNPGAQAADTQSNYTKSTITFTDPQDSQNNLAVSLESSLDSTTGDSSLVTSIQAGGETAKSGGLYFTGNTLLIKKADLEKPMIQHTLDPTVAASYKSLPAIERFMRVLSDTTQPKMNDADWEKAIDAYLQTVSSGAAESSYVSEQQAVALAGTSQDCTSTTLTLAGESATTIARGLVSLIAQDSSFKALFIPQYLVTEGTYGVTGLDGVLRDLDALTPDERSAMAVTFKILQNDKSSALYLSAVTGQKSMSILFKFFEDGSVRENDIVFTGFDGGGVKLTEQNASAGGENYAGQLVYEQTAPGGVIQEHTEANTTSTISSDSYKTNAQFKYTRVASGDSGAMDFSGTVDYTQQTIAQVTSGQATGTFISVSDGEAETLNLSMSLEQSNTAPPVTVPQFLPAAGISTTDEASLYATLAEGLESAQFNLAPASIRVTAALLLVFS